MLCSLCHEFLQTINTKAFAALPRRFTVFNPAARGNSISISGSSVGQLYLVSAQQLPQAAQYYTLFFCLSLLESHEGVPLHSS